jgi:hypothetical protein
MSCRETRRLLSYRREWTPAEGAAARTHLGTCLACQAIARQYELMDLRLGRLPAPKVEVRLPARVSEQWSAGEEAQPAARPAAPSLSGGWAAALLALLAAVLVVATVWSPPPPKKALSPLAAPGVAHPVPREPEAEPQDGTPGTGPAGTLSSVLVTYTMGVTEDLGSVAQRFGLQPVTLLMANLPASDYPNGGTVDPVLIIPPVDGALYTVQPGDTLEKVALRHRVSHEAIIAFEPNGLEPPYELQPGRLLMVPDASIAYHAGLYFQSGTFSGITYPPPDAPKGSGTFARPAEGVMTQGYWSEHYAIDIANEAGTPVLAADHGYVVLASEDFADYGNMVLISHGNGYTTRYAQLEAMLVKTGDVVTKGQQIGTMGSTGNARAPHLHFEIIEQGLRRNPLDYLP